VSAAACARTLPHALKSTLRKVLRSAVPEFNLPFILLSFPINSPE